MSDDFFIPTGEELDQGEVAKPKKRRFLRKKAKQEDKEPRSPRRKRLDVPPEVGSRTADGLLDTGSSGRVVRSVSSTSAAARRDFVVPDELRAKYGLDRE